MDEGRWKIEDRVQRSDDRSQMRRSEAKKFRYGFIAYW
jgi:hypothetical protein